jgi:exosome complex component RRP42
MSETTRKDHLIKGLTQEVRFDGRKNEEYRKITIEYGISKNAEGSAKVTIGETVVLAGVKMSIEKPYADRAEEGSLMVEGELRAMSNPHFEPGPPSIQAIELARVVDRGIREAKAVDFKKLCIEKGEKAWFVSIDVVTINDAGNLLDAAGLAAIAALKDARFPKYDGTAVNYKELTKEKLPIVKIPIPITVIKIGNNLIVDPTNEEEEFIDARLTVASIEDGTLCALQKGGSVPLTIEEIGKMVEIAKKKSKEIRKLL